MAESACVTPVPASDESLPSAVGANNASLRPTSCDCTLNVPPPAAALKALLAVIATLIVLSSIGQGAKHIGGHSRLKGFVPLTYVDYEANLPTWYSSAALLAASLSRGARRGWPRPSRLARARPVVRILVPG
jgi:hypothetical protein